MTYDMEKKNDNQIVAQLKQFLVFENYTEWHALYLFSKE